jgi:hypothetical protein
VLREVSAWKARYSSGSSSSNLTDLHILTSRIRRRAPRISGRNGFDSGGGPDRQFVKATLYRSLDKLEPGWSWQDGEYAPVGIAGLRISISIADQRNDPAPP